MNIAILCRSGCPRSLETFRALKRGNFNVPLVIAEADFRAEPPATIREMNAVKRQFLQTLRTPIHRTPKYLMHSNDPEQDYKQLRPAFERECRRNQAPLVYVSRVSSEETAGLFDKYRIDYALLASYQWLVLEPLLSHRAEIINLHPGLLPNHRSLDSVPWSILADDPVGSTTHFVDAGIDTGPVLYFHEELPLKDDDLVSYIPRLNTRKDVIFVKTMQGIRDGGITPKPQRLEDGVTHTFMTLEEILRANDYLKERIRNGYCAEE